MNGTSNSNDFQKTFVILGTWFDKVTKTPKSSAAEIKSGISKENRTPYAIVDDKNRLIIDGTFDVGTILTGKMTMSVSEVTPSTPAPQAAKLNLNTK